MTQQGISERGWETTDWGVLWYHDRGLAIPLGRARDDGVVPRAEEEEVVRRTGIPPGGVCKLDPLLGRGIDIDP